MPTKPSYELGARILVAQTGPDPSDAFSQTAAENKKPHQGMGLTENSQHERSETDKSDLRRGPERDAAGQSEINHAGGSNDGTVSANPRVLSKKRSGDATFPVKKRE